MSQENVQAARRAYELWNSGRMEEFLEMGHADLDMITSGAFPGLDSEYHGREGFVRWRDAMLEAWESFRLEPVEILDGGDCVFVALRLIGKGHGSGVEVTLTFHHVLHFRDGLVDRLGGFTSRTEALEAAGLSE